MASYFQDIVNFLNAGPANSNSKPSRNHHYVERSERRHRSAYGYYQPFVIRDKRAPWYVCASSWVAHNLGKAVVRVCVLMPFWWWWWQWIGEGRGIAISIIFPRQG